MGMRDDVEGLFAEFGGDCSTYRNFEEKPISKPVVPPVPKARPKVKLTAVPVAVPVPVTPPTTPRPVLVSSAPKPAATSLSSLFQRLLKVDGAQEAAHSGSPLERLRRCSGE